MDGLTSQNVMPVDGEGLPGKAQFQAVSFSRDFDWESVFLDQCIAEASPIFITPLSKAVTCRNLGR